MHIPHPNTRSTTGLIIKLPQSGELRARLVKDRCKEFPELKTCLYPSRGVHKRMLPVEDKKFALCVMGKTGELR